MNADLIEQFKNGELSWESFFDERQLKEIRFSEVYADQYSHGTDGHNAKIIIAKMAKLLDIVEGNIKADE